ncbi:MAG: glycosyltransferase family 9 protein [Planctomycetota bacterium]
MTSGAQSDKAWTVLHGGALGDLVLTLQLALRLPGVSETRALTVVSRVDPGDLSAHRPQIIRHSAEVVALHWLFADGDAPPPPGLAELIRSRRVLNALTGPQSPVHRRLAALAPLALYSFDPRPQPGAQQHITAQWQAHLAAQGLPRTSSASDGPHLRTPSASDGPAGAPRSSIAPGPTRRVLIHPGSGGRPKCWPLANFIRTARLLRDMHSGTPPLHVTFVLGHVELETWPASDLRQLDELAAEFPLIRSPSPSELVALLASADVYIGNDSGPTHLAAFLRTPTLAIFGPTSPLIWRPLGPHVHVFAGRPDLDPLTWTIHPAAVASAGGMAAFSQPHSRSPLPPVET